MQTKDTNPSNKHEEHEQETDANDDDDAGEQENPNTTVHMDVIEEQETNTQRVKIVSNDSKDPKSKIEVKIPLELNKLVSVHDKRKNAVVVDMPDVNETGRRQHMVLVNFMGSSPQQTNKLWMQNQAAPPKLTWSEWWQGKQYPEGFVGPLNYTPATRNPFVKLVLSIVFIMLLATAGLVAYVWNTPDVKEYFQLSGWTLILPAMLVFVAIDYAMICSPCSRMMPCNCILLILAVLCMSVIAAKITVRYRSEVMIYACLSTAAVVLVCVFLACTNFDFTSWTLYLVVIGTAFSVVAMIIGIVMLMGTVIKPLLITILVIGTLIQVVALTIQLQMILGGKAIELSEDDYGLGAFMLYTSILDIFLKMVQIIGLTSE